MWIYIYVIISSPNFGVVETLLSPTHVEITTAAQSLLAKGRRCSISMPCTEMQPSSECDRTGDNFQPFLGTSASSFGFHNLLEDVWCKINAKFTSGHHRLAESMPYPQLLKQLSHIPAAGWVLVVPVSWLHPAKIPVQRVFFEPRQQLSFAERQASKGKISKVCKKCLPHQNYAPDDPKQNVFDPPTRSAAPQVPPSDWVGPKHRTSPLWRNGSQGWSAWRQGMQLWWNPVVSGTPIPLWTTPETGPLMVPRYVVYPCLSPTSMVSAGENRGKGEWDELFIERTRQECGMKI